MKKTAYYVYLLTCALVILFLLTMSVFSANSEYIVCNGLMIYKTNDTYIIPSSEEYSSIEFHSSTSEFSFNGKTYKSGSVIDVSVGKQTQIYDSIGYTVEINSSEIKFLKASNIPYISLDTTMGLSSITKTSIDRNVETQVFDIDGKLVYSDIVNNTFSELKVRGNATASYAKKPYQLKLGKKADLFSMGKAKTYILLANYIDPSYLRNMSAFKYASELDMAYTPNSTQVMLYVDGVCKGLYQLCEKTQINSNRIEIFDLEEETDRVQKNDLYKSSSPTTVVKGDLIDNTCLISYSYIPYMKNPEDITGGYLIELDNLYGNAEKCKFKTSHGNTYVIKSPELATKEEVEYIAELFANMEDALYSDNGYTKDGKHYSDFIDVDSLAKMFTLEEMAKEWDAFVGSQFFYKDRDENGITSKIYAGPVWDFDNSWGTMTQGTYASDKTGIWSNVYSTLGRPNANNHLGIAIQKQPILKSLISKYASESESILLDISKDGGYLDICAKELKDASSCDKVIWGVKGRLSAFIVFDSFTDGKDNNTSTAVGYLKDFIDVRTRALVDTFKYDLDEGYKQIKVESNDIEINSEYYKAGENASFRYSGYSEEIQIKDESGNVIDFVYKDGFVYFIMPNSDAIILITKKEIESTKEIETISTSEETTTVETTNIETTSDINTETTIEPTNGKSDVVVIIFAISGVLIIGCVITLTVISNRRKKEREDV